MDDRSDSRLLHDYAERRSDDAFAALVRRHIDLVHSAALRMVNDPHLAQDVTQNTFVALAKNATELKTRPVIAGWLHRTAQNIAAQTVRTDVRRRNREQEATAMNTLLSETPDASWHDIAPHLDIALGGLDEPDRDAVLLRYFEKKSAHEMAAQLGISDDAAQKRVSRAVERLREFFAKRGVTVGASGLAVVISANAVQAAPVGLAITISTAAVLTGTTLATAATLTATKAIAMTTLQKTIVTATVAVLAGAGIYEARQNSQLRDQVQTLQQQQAPLKEQVAKLYRALSDATNQFTSLREDNERLNRNATELLKLRGEVTRLRVSSQERTNDSDATAAKSWLARVNKLKQRLEQNPRERIPELVFASEDDWLSAAKNKLDSEINFRQALGSIRSIASAQAAHKFLAALKQYLKANNGQFPTDMSQLTTFLPQSIDSSIMARWEIQPASNFRGHGLKGDWLIVEKEAVDEAYDYRWLVSSDQSNCIPFGERAEINKEAMGQVLEPVTKAFAAANGGREPKNPMEALPYATTPEQQAAMQIVIRLYQQHIGSTTNQTQP